MDETRCAESPSIDTLFKAHVFTTDAYRVHALRAGAAGQAPSQPYIKIEVSYKRHSSASKPTYVSVK